MCGIAGYIGRRKISKKVLRETLTLMQNRGPDFQDFSEFLIGDTYVYLLHSRLSIIDLDPRSNQPYSFENLHLIFNGELYNYIEVRSELKTLGYQFETDGDTEVLIKAYHYWGEGMYEKLEGMWAFAIFDESNVSLHISRDRFAEKPLYFSTYGDEVIFGSEVKFLNRLSEKPFEINNKQIYRYLVNGYKSLYKHGDTFYKNVHEVPFAGFLKTDSSLEINSQIYWKPLPKIQEDLSISDAIEGVRERLINSVKLRLRSDVPLAFCLSGGIDSASLASIAAKEFNYNVHSFSIIDQDIRYNEYNNIMATVNDIGCNQTLVELKPENMIERLRDLVSYHDGPVATISYLIHSMLSEQIAKHGYRVSISGTAADELLTGYYDHFNLHLNMVRDHEDYQSWLDQWNQYLRPIVRNPHLQNPELYFDNEGFRSHIYLNNDTFRDFLIPDFFEEFQEFHFTDHLLHNRMLNELFFEGSRVILKEDDLNSMFYSIENRSPYLDTDLFEFSYSIPTHFLIQNGYAKYILREAVKGILNEQVRLDRHKKGFNASINSLIDFKNKNDREILLEESQVFEIVKRESIEGIFKDDLPNSYSKFLFNFMNVKLFLEEHGS